MKRKFTIGVVTGTRADYGILKRVIFILKNKEYTDKDIDVDLRVIATGAHMSKDFGMTYKILEEDGINIFAKIPIVPSDDGIYPVLESMSYGLKEFADLFTKNKFDLIIVLRR